MLNLWEANQMKITDIGCSQFSGEAGLMTARDDRLKKKASKTLAGTKDINNK